MRRSVVLVAPWRAGTRVSKRAWTAEQYWVAALIVAALVTLLGALGLPLGPLRIVAGTFGSFFAAGYALILIVRPRQLAPLARGVLAVPLSFAVTIFWGAALNLSPFGVYTHGLAIATSLTALALFLIAARLGRSALPRTLPLIAAPQLARPHWSVLVAGLVVALALVWVGRGLYSGSRPIPMAFTEFYLLSATPIGPDGTTIHLGVRNQEGGTREYRVQVTRESAGDLADPGATPVAQATTVANVAIERTLTVPNGAEETVDVVVPVQCGESVEATLWLAGNAATPTATAYRTVRARPICGTSGTGATPSPARAATP